MSKQKFEIIDYDALLERMAKLVESKKADSAMLMSMNFFARPGSLAERLALAIQNAKRTRGGLFEIRYDKGFAERSIVFPDGHYSPKFSPWDPQHWPKKLKYTRAIKRSQKKFSDILSNSPLRFYDIPTSGGFVQRLLSWHPCEFLCANHAKSGVMQLRDGTSLAIIATGELISSSRQDNLALIIKNNEKATKFVEAATNPETKIGSHGYQEEEIFPRANLIVDYGNYGEPGMISRIHELAEMMVSPLFDPRGAGGEPPKHRPTDIVVITQYAPGGRFRRALRLASMPVAEGGFGARVTVPVQPKGDYRRHDPGYWLMFQKFMLRKGKHIRTPELKVSTHIKCLIVKYDDGRSSMIFGTDNFDSAADIYYRNTEIAIHIDRVARGEEGYDMIETMLDKLVELGEISKSVRKYF
ncbi:MAG: hypothetical protein LBC95_00275 [Candidatus Nomurabacteria bacterium]|jgi:hypothetical protein|nr:hypothetical protein [Candidatus Nomurabacteria bacterium]